MTRARLALVLAVLAVAALVTAVVLVHAGGHQTLSGEKEDPDDPDAPTTSTTIEVACAAASSGPNLTDKGDPRGVDERDGDTVAEDDKYTLGREGIESVDVVDACGRVRTERVTLAVELAFLSLLLGGLAVGTKRGRTWDPVDRTPSAPRPDDGAVL